MTLDANGRYAVMLGSLTANGLPSDVFVANTARWLGVQVEAELEQARFMLVSVPYALKAADADTVAGKTVKDFVLAENLNESVKSALTSPAKETAEFPHWGHQTTSPSSAAAAALTQTQRSTTTAASASGRRILERMRSWRLMAAGHLIMRSLVITPLQV